MNAQDSLNKLKDGNARFINGHSLLKIQNKHSIESLINDQQPYAIILGCTDSRVAPEILFDTGLGELFVIRVAGNIANTSSIASIEYAIANLGTKLIIVMGHQSCGAVTVAVAGGDHGHNLNHLLSHITPAISGLKKGATINEVVIKNAKLAAEDLKNKSEIISNAIDNEGVVIAPAYYNLTTGRVDFI